MWRAIEKYGVIFIRFYLGGFNLVSGLNYFLLFWPQPRIAESTGNDYVLLSMELGLFQFAKVCEIVGGATLVVSTTRNFVMHGILLVAYANYFYPMLKFRSAPQPAWRDVSRVWKSF
jgi:putative oxidoreductase